MKNRKRISVLLVLAMVMTMLAGLAAPAAASTRVVVESAVATHPSATTPTPRTPGRIDILRTVSFPVVTGGDQTRISITLPSGVTWVTTGAVAGNVTTTPTPVDTFTPATPTFTDSDRTVTFTVGHAANVDAIRFMGRDINVPANFTGNIDATVALRGETTGGDFLWEQTSTVRIASIVTGATALSAVTTPNVVRGAPGQTLGSIDIREVVTGTIATGTITLEAPVGVTFTGTPAAALHAGTGLSVGATAIDTNPRRITIAVTDAAGTAATIRVTGLAANVDLTVADGPINIRVFGSGTTDATVAAATVGVAGTVTASAITPPALPTVNAGRLAETVASIRLTENMVNAFLGNRVLTLALPTGFTWNSVAAPAWAVAAPTVSSDGRTLTFWTDGDPIPTGSPANQFDLGATTINTHATAPVGDIVVTVGGNAGASGTVTVGTLRKPVSVTAATVPNLRADLHDQAVGNLVITEAAAATLIGGQNITITFPTGVTFVGTPTVAATVYAGGTAPTFGAVTHATNVLTVPVNAQSVTHPATVTISGIRVNLDRVPAGTAITAKVGGAAVLEAGGSAGLADVLATLPADAVTAARGTVAAEAALGNVISRTFTRSVFTIGALSFVRDGVSTTIDAAPTVKDGRTFLPLRFAALAVGVSEDDIIWDGANRTVTLLRGDRVVQLRIGNKNMTINGVVVPMDVAASIEGGRTVLPIRFVALALRAGVVWDGTARTVTVTAE